jgi:hypothetical protein
MDRYDKVVAAVLADPRVASDPTNPDVRAYLELFPAVTGTVGSSV